MSTSLPAFTGEQTRHSMAIGSLCSGIGAFELGLLRAGFGPVLWQVEIDSYCRSVLARHWPEVTRFDDITTVDPSALASVDLICAGFPCQPVSVAGKRAGESDKRWLWPHVVRIVESLRPRYLVIENVPGLRTLGLRTVLADLAAIGFDAEWTSFRASDLGAPHERNRIWLVATDSSRVTGGLAAGWLTRSIGAAVAVQQLRTRQSEARQVPTDSDCARRLEQALSIAAQRGWAEHCGWRFDPTARVDDGHARGMVERQRKALGNSIVVACAETVGRAILDNCGGVA